MVDKNQQIYQEYKNENYNKKLNDKLINLIKNLPESNGSRYFKKIDKNIGIIADEFMYDYYKDCANFIYINFFKYKEIIKNNKIDLFLYVTAWRGLDNNDWRGAAKKDTLYEIIDYFKSKGIPTVFQSKEDPSNYNIFIDVAQKCDYIFTTDANKIDDYKKDCKNENVYLCTFGINPILHNPIGINRNQKLKEVLFAGSWMKKYPHRGKDMKKIFDGVLDSGRKLDIIDRNFYINSKSYFYPPEYIPYTSPPINHRDLQKVHKLYDWIINLNSIKYSPTMCALRCYEAQALGNCIISNYSMAINYDSPNIFIVYDESQVKSILNGFDEDEIYKRQMYGVRNVMNDRCAFDKMLYILKIVDDDIDIKNNKKRVLVVVDKITDNITEMFENQIFEEKYLVELDKAKEIYGNYDFVTFFKDNYFYGEHYLQDMINGFKYTDSDYITKDSYYNGEIIIYGIEHDYVNKMKDKFKTMFDAKKFTLDFLNLLKQEVDLKNGYSIDRYELNVKENINFDLKIRNIFKNLKSVIKNNIKLNKVYKFSVIVDVWNNGNHVLNKCFSSLKRSSMFDDMEIILLDNNSDDKETIAILNRLNREYKNVKVYRFSKDLIDNIEQFINISANLSNGDFIIFMSGYNEVVNDGYVELYKKINNSDYDIAMGNVLKVYDKEELIQYCKSTIIENIRNNTEEGKLDINSIQGMLIRKDFILNNNLNYDNKFLNALVRNDNKIELIDSIVYISYDENM